MLGQAALRQGADTLGSGPRVGHQSVPFPQQGGWRWHMGKSGGSPLNFTPSTKFATRAHPPVRVSGNSFPRDAVRIDSLGKHLFLQCRRGSWDARSPPSSGGWQGRACHVCAGRWPRGARPSQTPAPRGERAVEAWGASTLCAPSRCFPGTPSRARCQLLAASLIFSFSVCW